MNMLHPNGNGADGNTEMRFINMLRLIIWFGAPSGPKYLQHFFPCNFSSWANPKTGKTT